MVATLFNMPIIGGISLGLALMINVLVIRYILQYQRETRDEYSRRLTRAVIELEAQKTRNVELEYEIDRLKNLKK